MSVVSKNYPVDYNPKHIALEEIFEEQSGFSTENAEAMVQIQWLWPREETAAEYERQRENFFNELEIVFADVLHLDANSGVTLKIKGM
ncbi:hypothetical protein SO802_021845 [Lithocarpus litseifolius]|uniref:Uncharacterized protein n=1 Tax=Lithocarpus litseifolius TaxID=425828 RepID=A0AAW2CKC0_9ROSI